MIMQQPNLFRKLCVTNAESEKHSITEFGVELEENKLQ